ncbi:MAG: Gfo/Idh/MocA family oxidoreductase [Chloroflexi bacterium]|nr:Gfo/Idh/MocA family oxidoreductase [Chloroflexota bacterium]
MTTDTDRDTLRIGFIGAGANTRSRHIPGFQAIEGVELAAVCNRSRESGQRVAEEFGIARVAEDPGALFDDPEIDAICIGTWPYRHREYSVRALEAGKHVLCEARMAMDAAEAREMLAAAQARPDLVAQLVPAPFDLASWRTIRRLLAEGALGELREAHVTVLGGGALDPAQPLHWRERGEYSGRNTMMLGIFAETVQRWLGPTERVVADAATFVTSRRDQESGEDYEIGIPDSLGVFARMANGARVSYQLSGLTHAPAIANGISLYGSAASLHWTQAGDGMSLAPLGEEPRLLEPDPGTAGAWNVEADFVASIREGAPVELTSFEDGLRYMQFTEAVWRSWSEGRAVALDEL